MDCRDIIDRAGGVAKVARALGLHHTTVLRWNRIPAPHARAVAALASLPSAEVRPDLYGDTGSGNPGAQACAA